MVRAKACDCRGVPWALRRREEENEREPRMYGDCGRMQPGVELKRYSSGSCVHRSASENASRFGTFQNLLHGAQDVV
jgi:hypothetical protein